MPDNGSSASSIKKPTMTEYHTVIVSNRPVGGRGGAEGGGDVCAAAAATNTATLPTNLAMCFVMLSCVGVHALPSFLSWQLNSP
jgi:hypothetical protein